MVAYDGAVLKAALQQAQVNLRGRVDEVNALNVFPVPYGDTGTNSPDVAGHGQSPGGHRGWLRGEGHVLLP